MTEMTNTLFRFATMRSPELLNQQPREKYFVYHPDPLEEGHFKDFIAEEPTGVTSRIASGQVVAETFTPIASVEALKTYVGADFFNFANWLAKNATALQTNLTLLTGTGYDTLTPLNSTKIINLWDNLFYHLLTNQSASIREQVIEALVAQHFITTYESGTPDSKIALSKVTIPQQFFGTNAIPDPATPPDPVVYTKQIEKDLDMILAKDKADRCRILLEELKKAQQKYDSIYRQDFNDARAAYDSALLADIAERTTQDEATGDIEIEFAPFAPFVFTPEDQITTDMINGLTLGSKLLANEFSLALLTTFEEAFDRVNLEIMSLDHQGFDSVKLNNKIVNLNSVIIPVSDTIKSEHEYSLFIKPVPRNDLGFRIFVGINTTIPDADIVSASYSVTLPYSITVTGTNFIDQVSGNTLIVELFPNGVSLPGGNEVYELSLATLNGSLKLKNNVTIDFSEIIVGQNPVKGKAYVTDTATANPGSNTPNFIPSDIGVRRLGIADYRQVEQTTCCYVPGEVSHIENVMAREYKEKSSRRLRRSEDTSTVERQTEKEDLTDTTSTDRYEMQQQTSVVINKDISSNVSSSSNFNVGGASFNLGSNFATNTSQQQSNSQAVSYAKDITQRAQERVVQKIREERVIKIVDEFEEQNKHGFDNRKGNQHVSGVYRWVDKIYKNKIFNYGKRLMYEFLIPQPAVFHTEAMKTISNSPSVSVLEKPVDPRTQDLKDHRNVMESTAASWAAVYNAEIESVPEQSIRISKSISLSGFDIAGNEEAAKADKIELPDGYKAVSAVVNYMFYYHPTGPNYPHVLIAVGDKKTPLIANSLLINNTVTLSFDQPINNEVGVGIEAGDLSAISCNVVLNCVRTDQYYRQWQLNAFNTIIGGYEKKLAAYNDALAAAQVTAVSKASNPLFYRQIENTVLRKNCIAYLAGQANMGKKFYTGSTLQDLQSRLDSEMDSYASLARFIEQAFEWDIISYTFYPFYWGDRAAWQNMYQVEVDDALFRSFLQSGLARVVATVRPGFEEAVLHYMATGQVWNGGQVPVIGDDMYLSIIEELKNPTYYVEETWETRVPTTLTVIQAGSIGLNTEGLPCCEEEEETGIAQSTALMTGADEETGG